MKNYRAELFEEIRDKLLKEGKKVYLYFISDYKYEKGELIVEGRPYICADDNLLKLFNSIDKKEILSNLNFQYRKSWDNAYKNAKNELSHGRKLLRLNTATTALFGPYFNKTRAAQSYNVYISLYFNLNEVESIVDKSKLDYSDRIVLNSNEFYTIDAVANALSKDVAESSNSYENNEQENKPQIETEEIDVFAKLKSIKLTNFLNLNNADIAFSPGINLIIGGNNTGKTGFMKFLYANAKAYEEYGKVKGTSKARSFKEFLSIKLQTTFQSEDKIGGIVNKSSDNELTANLIFTKNNIEDKSIKLAFKKATKTEIVNLDYQDIYQSDDVYKYNTVFVPAKEILSIKDAIKVAINYPTDGFDATYEDLLNDIEPLFAERSKENILNKIAKDFEENIIDGEIEYNKSKDKYYYKDKSNRKFDLTMTAEGIKQIGIIPLLIRTGKITEGTILFLDEPDNNLNPHAVRKLVKTLLELANAGVQIFISTHHHMLSQYISLYSEFRDTVEGLNYPASKFFAFYTSSNGRTSIESGVDLLDIQNNLILDEYVKLGDKEQEFIAKSKK